ncbi:hypothetical protein L1787_03565 [Acuticoccus sp. M5D2P5]|uniref:hypothetical protein n=1 Tax=Acuticoccus kalidii TaxID=2910977 RepID=UPI001F47B385|nr:hypothetical protein [Acuticoccus kalidii]MCF3932493.1 hypothetical protein [Acuticoccus kalidii]
MGRSADRLRRVAEAQRALARLAAAEHRAAEDAYRESEAQGAAIVEALNEDSPLHGMIVTTMAGALQRNARRTEELRRRAAAAHHRHAKEDVAARRLDENAKTAEAGERRSEAAKQLLVIALEHLQRRR